MKASNSLRDGLVGAWAPSVSGWGGTMLRDLSGNGNHGTLTNMDPATDWVVHNGYQALDFDGSNDYLSLFKNITKENAGWTFAAWYSPNSIAAYQTIISHGSSASFFDSRQLAINNTGKAVAFEGDGTGIQLAVGTTTISSGTLNYLVAVYPVNPANPVLIYLNGVNENNQATRKSPTPNVSAIGQSVLNGSLANIDPANGKLSDARIYNRALSPQEIRTLYDGGPGYGLRPQRTRRYHAASSFSPSWVRRQNLIGSGVY